VYGIVVIAESDRGPGYKAKHPILFKTMAFTELCEVYVWGKNANSEIGLTDEMCEANNAHYRKDKSIMY